MGLSKTIECFSLKTFNKEVAIEMEDFGSLSMDEIMIRFPILFQAILKELDNKSLRKCRKVNKDWQEFIGNERFVLFRKIQKYHSSMEEFYEQWKKVTQNASKETIRELSVAVYKFFEGPPIRYYMDEPIKKRNEEQWSPLHITAGQGHLELSRYIIDKTGDKNPKNSKGATAFQLAAQEGQLEICKVFIQNLEDKNPTGYDDWTTLHFAAVYGHLEVCRLINENIDNGATVTTLTQSSTPVDCAAMGGHLEVFKLFTQTLENKNQAANADNWTPLHQAASGGHIDLCRYILDSGADKRPIGHGAFLGYASTPLEAAASEGRLRTCKLFIDESADLIKFVKAIYSTLNRRVYICAGLLTGFVFVMFIELPFLFLLTWISENIRRSREIA